MACSTSGHRRARGLHRVHPGLLGWLCVFVFFGITTPDLAVCESPRETTSASAPDASLDVETKPQTSRTPDILLISLDTTRADALGAYIENASTNGGVRKTDAPVVLPNVSTPHLDAVAARGVRYEHAITAAPLTLPAHASLLTGLEPPRHGVRDNATDALAPSIPTLAGELARRGYDTAAFVGSKVLDRRFGLDSGFALYDDEMLAERVGEYGYPERDAQAVVDSALGWLAERAADRRPYFAWLHVYDPHAPYRPPGHSGGGSELERYVAEVTYVDRQLGRILDTVDDDTIVAVVADHGEALGEHGERTHGLLLYRSVLRVPLLLAGPGIEPAVVDEAVATRRLAATLLALAAPDAAEALPGPVLPGVLDPPSDDGLGIYSETLLPATAYGWSALRALTLDRWRLIDAPRPELYDVIADPAEAKNRVDDERRVARRLEGPLRRFEKTTGERRSGASIDPELAREVAQLGYLSGWSTEGSGLDPKDGLKLLERYERAKELRTSGRVREAVALLEALVEDSPGNVPFMNQLATALLDAGRTDDAITAFRRAVSANPGLEFTRFHLAVALAGLGRFAEARTEIDEVLSINPRFADAWLTLAQIEARTGGETAERKILVRAVDAGTTSASVLLRLGQLEAKAGDVAAGAERMRQATEIAPGWSTAWIERSRLAWERGDLAAARQSLEKALAVAPPGSREADTARRLLQAMSAESP
ncbi:MAG: sulfatase-like hydrolase/transferase [Acidobacteriota bacterium]